MEVYIEQMQDILMEMEFCNDEEFNELYQIAEQLLRKIRNGRIGPE